MRVSDFPIFTLKDNPSDAEIVSHKLMIRAGLIRQISSGQYSWLPIGMRVLEKIQQIIRSELNNIGCMEISMPLVQPSELWKESGRWDKYGPELLRFKDRNDRDFCFGPTFEEVVTDLVRKDISSYKQLPLNFFQITTKFRDEIRPRFGVMRAREFIMKDAYSFHADKNCLDESYNSYKKAYGNIFKRLGLNFTVVSADSGNIGGDESHEYHVIADTGEDDLLISDNGDGMNVEIAKEKYSLENLDELIDKTSMKHKKGIEVGHIFKLGQKYTKSMDTKITHENGTMNNIFMGCYGIGVTRIVAAAIEQNHDDSGIIWPTAISPFKCVIIEIDASKNNSVKNQSDVLYKMLKDKNIDVIVDNRDVGFGIKMKDWELIGIPHFFIIGKNEAAKNIVTHKLRTLPNKNSLQIEDIEMFVEKNILHGVK
ncbi:MAG: proline--tRNA ligase [Pseudomonadota bacterium]|nr:proline--tRNA ligase [Pseudomonadota bacterium]